MAAKPVPVLVLDSAAGASAALQARLAARGFAPTCNALGAADPAALPRTDLAVLMIDPAASPQAAQSLTQVLEALGQNEVSTLVWGAPKHFRLPTAAPVEWLSPDVGLDELVGRVAAIARYAPMLKQMERETEHLQRLGEQLNRYFSEIDQEMRLAGRLQRDLLPQTLPAIPPLEFAALFRPASWVSGDMYDVFPIDRDHVGIFIADAMGHGVAAGLITMFIRQALLSKVIDEHTGGVAAPGRVLRELHEALLRQRMPTCQFVTAIYGVVDLRTCDLVVARAGHPYPILMRADGAIGEIPASGGLLGLADAEAEFTEAQVALCAGDKLLLYTDGMEDQVIQSRSGDPPATEFMPHVRSWSPHNATGMIQAVDQFLNEREGSLHPEDDVTVVAMSVSSVPPSLGRA